MDYTRPVVLSIAGLDPSGGAGVLADVKTFEQHRCLGFGVVSALTVQTEDTLYRADWMSLAHITAQAEPLFARYVVDVVKIGIVEDFVTLYALVRWLRTKRAGVRIVWDPVVSSSSGFRFIDNIDRDLLGDVLRELYLLTPNAPEAVQLAGIGSSQDAARALAAHCAVYLKGGHVAEAPGTDYLYDGGSERTLLPTGRAVWPKHGSGCILSSALASRLAWGDSLPQACVQAKEYIEQILGSNKNLLAYHHV